LVFVGILLALGNFMVVLDTTIANVSVPNIAGGLAVSPSEGTWVITSYSVAEAIVVPLTGWLAGRFGAVRLFVGGIMGFGLCSALCGLAPSLGFLVFFRVLQGICGGPIMPMSQTLMMRLFPPKQRAQMMGVWGMTTVVGPIAGPILGGRLCDSVGWPWIFYINVPVVMLVAFFGWRMMSSRETPTMRRPVDIVGLVLLIVTVGAFQIMLDKGKDLDWFGSPLIIGLALVAAVGLVAFLIWELTDEHPVVDLRVFRHPGFASATVTISLTFGAFFAGIVLVPLWLQTNMGYTATWAGYVSGFGGMLAVVCSPIAARLMTRIDARALVTFATLWLAGVSIARSGMASNANFWTIALPFLAQGVAMPFYFIPVNQIALSSVLPSEMAAAAGLANFTRTISAAVATSIMTTMWDNAGSRLHSDLAGRLAPSGTLDALQSMGLTPEQALNQVDGMTQGQAVMLATNQMFLVAMVIFLIAACAVWLGPKPKLAGGAGGAGGH
jgi:DHA2 family multidrug resistance protein